MNHLETLSIEAAVAFYNEIATRFSYPNYKILWKTGFGLATGNVVHYNDLNELVITESHDDLDSWNTPYTPQEVGDLFAAIRHKVIPYFISDSGFSRNRSIMHTPDILLAQLIKLSKIETTDNLKMPNYSSIRNFQTIDKSIDLPFITFEAAKVESVATLILEN